MAGLSQLCEPLFHCATGGLRRADDVGHANLTVLCGKVKDVDGQFWQCPSHDFFALDFRFQPALLHL